MKLTIRLSPTLRTSDVPLVRFEPGKPAELEIADLVVEWDPPVDERATEEHLQELEERLERERADFARLERLLDDARERLARYFGIDLDTTNAPSLDSLLDRLEALKWPSLVALLRLCRDREHPRDRDPADRGPYRLAIPDDLFGFASVSYFHDHERGVRIFTLEELDS